MPAEDSFDGDTGTKAPLLVAVGANGLAEHQVFPGGRDGQRVPVRSVPACICTYAANRGVKHRLAQQSLAPYLPTIRGFPRENCFTGASETNGSNSAR